MEMKSCIKHWPEEFPNDVPPKNAQPANGVFYRWGQKGKKPKDFLPTYLAERRRATPEEYADYIKNNSPECFGASVWKDKDEAERKMAETHKRVPHSKKNQRKKMYQVQLCPALGVMLRTLKEKCGSHYTVWLKDDVQLEKYAHDVEKGQ